uniref:LNS2/PITP domain-containing protein n=3 Tax=Hemiselmis andersenii TaxID=464988 RepID=A0A7S1HB04_HEMAN|mmetsp:Transcript_51066/g.123811  ORF Transcript_51066/g.123811 Transcript_51066/m.123811 type:complete len:243 (+) Transcript_51066:200-928(+)
MQAIQEALDGIRNSFDFVSGANDVIVVHHRDGSVTCSAFSVQTSAHTVNRHLLGKQVQVHLNGQLIPLQMTIGQDGRCVFGDGTYVPQVHEISQLPLRDGRNSLDFRVGSTLLANAGLFSWKWSDLIVIVDIDGTITRTDSGGVLASSEFGQQLGLAHAHKGVCSAMSQIASAGYRLLFLTARPITRSEATRKYLSTIGHEETPPVMMPEGALITSAMGTLGTMANVWKDLKSYKLTQLREI